MFNVITTFFSLQLPFEKEIYYIQHSMLYLVPLYLFRKGGMCSVFVWLRHDSHAGLQYLFFLSLPLLLSLAVISNKN